MNFLIKIWTAFILDLIFGDPEKITHPVQIIGKMIAFLEKRLPDGRGVRLELNGKFKGFID